MQKLHSRGTLTPEMIDEKHVRNMVDEYCRIIRNATTPAIDAGVKSGVIPEEMKRKLNDDVFLFSGFKTYNELKEASGLLRDEAGQIKPFNRFYNDITAIKQDYNKNWLKAEYIFATQSAQMAAKWKEMEEDGDRYNLQYRTAGDDRVRPEHRMLNRITLPQSDKFWDEYYPPNGWRCRCTVVQVRKSKYPVSDSNTAQQLGKEATYQAGKNGVNKAAIFRFNPGKQQVIFPPHHPYYSDQCATCERRNGKAQLSYKATNKELCSVCDRLVRNDISAALDKLTHAKGADYINTLRSITKSKIFKKVENTENVYSAINESDHDFSQILDAAKKAVNHGYTVYVMPNPSATKSADCIFVRKGVYKMYDLKTIIGQNSVGDRLAESVGQTNRVLLNLKTTYNAKSLAREIKLYFERNENALEVLIYKGNKEIYVRRSSITDKFVWEFRKMYET